MLNPSTVTLARKIDWFAFENESPTSVDDLFPPPPWTLSKGRTDPRLSGVVVRDFAPTSQTVVRVTQIYQGDDSGTAVKRVDTQSEQEPTVGCFGAREIINDFIPGTFRLARRAFDRVRHFCIFLPIIQEHEEIPPRDPGATTRHEKILQHREAAVFPHESSSLRTTTSMPPGDTTTECQDAYRPLSIWRPAFVEDKDRDSGYADDEYDSADEWIESFVLATDPQVHLEPGSKSATLSRMGWELAGFSEAFAGFETVDRRHLRKRGLTV